MYVRTVGGGDIEHNKPDEKLVAIARRCAHPGSESSPDGRRTYIDRDLVTIICLLKRTTDEMSSE